MCFLFMLPSYSSQHIACVSSSSVDAGYLGVRGNKDSVVVKLVLIDMMSLLLDNFTSFCGR